ncbi:tetratricopeptide repeat protein [Porphyrobacter algicida]|uniref:Tetratricopeptide repeat protein n=1 Tax=Qipengyuania algicida TaxID=1836209 RepID=A0A845ADA7_9SPHN|nr:tetratricopeptide repeat protein [Qipengyuania algicida]MXP27664.1 tetratricopeptide repeat protein [Qipengyuania algicida]
MAERYSAFISYSHADQSVASWLHRRIEGYRFPRVLRGHDSPFGPVPKRLPHVFRDRDELPASGDLGGELRAALADSRFQIVLCSPRAAQSKWVNEEILSFKRLHGEDRTLALILDGEPYSGGAEECFPEALRFRLGPDGALSDIAAEPIAADIRKGKDGRRLALLKLLAGIAGVPLDALARRDASRRQRRLAAVATATSMIAVLTMGLAIYAERQRRIAVQQRELAERSLDFLTGTFEIANPATENPRTITALTILDRASTRAGQQFRNDPLVAASLLRTTGNIYLNLGLPQESERDLRKALAFQPEPGPGRTRTLLKLGELAVQRGDADGATRLVDEAQNAIEDIASDHDELDARIMKLRGNIAYLRGDYRRAADILSAAAQRFRESDGDHRDELIGVISNEAQAWGQTSQVERSRRLYQSATKLTLEKYGLSDIHSAKALQNQALALFMTNNVDEAAKLMEQAVAVYHRVLEPDHPVLAAADLLLGRIEAAKGDFTAARQSFAQARSIFVKLYGPTNAAVGDTDFYTAEAEGQAGQTATALQLTQKVKAIYDRNYGPDDPDQAELLLLRARILERAGRKGDASKQCGMALALQRKLRLDRASQNRTKSYCESLSHTSPLRDG